MAPRGSCSASRVSIWRRPEAGPTAWTPSWAKRLEQASLTRTPSFRDAPACRAKCAPDDRLRADPRFSDVQLHIVVRVFDAPRNDESQPGTFKSSGTAASYFE